MRGYFTDGYIQHFTATVLREEQLEDGRFSVVLNETFFYPTSGGQPHDLGFINGVKVLDIIDGDEISHIVEKSIGQTQVECEIDWVRRFDHMQQHAGQHILSACFEKLYDAETVGFHLGDEYVTIDVTLEEFTLEMADKIEEGANEMIYRNLPIKIYFVSPDEIKALPLRKPPVVNENIRIVEVEGEDYSPCGGTHPHSTGEVGLIKIRKWEKKRNNIRVEFVCGNRALKDYQMKNNQINQIGNILSIKDQEVLEGFVRLNEDARELRREVGVLRGQLQVYEAHQLYTEAMEVKGVRIVGEIFRDRELGELKKLAGRITEKEKVVVAFALKGEKAQVILSRSEDVNINMNDLLKEVIGLINGTGGGTPRSAQGGGTDLSNLESLVETVRIILVNRYLK